MKYLLLIYDREQDWSKLSEAEQGKIYAEYMKFSQDIRESGNYISGAQLHPVASATVASRILCKRSGLVFGRLLLHH